MSMNIEKMKTDGINSYLIDLAEMNADSLKTKLAVNIENPAIFSQFIDDESNANWEDYAYAAGLITKAEALLLKSYEEEGEGEPFNPGEDAGLHGEG